MLGENSSNSILEGQNAVAVGKIDFNGTPISITYEKFTVAYNEIERFYEANGDVPLAEEYAPLADFLQNIYNSAKNTGIARYNSKQFEINKGSKGK